MNSDSENQAAPKRLNKWLRLGRNILVGAIITWGINFILLKTGWDSWESFSKQADNFAESMLSGASRLTPMSLWKSIQSDQRSYILEKSGDPYFPVYKETGKLTIKDKVINWLGYYWYKEESKPFWFGRIILIIVALASIMLAVEDYNSSKKKISSLIFFPVNLVIKFFILLLSLSLLALFLYFIIKILLFIAGGIVAIFSMLAACGGIVKIIVDEIRNEASDSSKKSLAAYMLPFLFSKGKAK